MRIVIPIHEKGPKSCQRGLKQSVETSNLSKLVLEDHV